MSATYIKCGCGHAVDEHAKDGCTFGWGYGETGLFGGCSCPNEGVGDFREMVK